MSHPMNVEPTTTATSPEPITKTGSSSDFTSFDDLEQVLEQESSSQSAPRKSAEKPSPKSEAKPSKGKAEDEEEGDQDKEESSESKKGDKEDGKEKTGKESEEVKVKTLKVRSGDKDVELRSDTLFQVKVDGKVETVKAEDLVNSYSHSTHLRREQTKLDQSKKELEKKEGQFQNSTKELQTAVSKLFELSQENPIEAIEYLAEIQGLDPLKIRGDLLGKIEQMMEEFGNLSPQEREARKLQQEREYLQKRLQREQADRSKRAEHDALAKRVQAVKSQHNIDDATYDRLEKEAKGFGLKPEEITPELLGKYHEEIQVHEQLGKLVKEVVPDHAEPKKLVIQLRELWKKDPDLSLEDLRDIAVEVYGSKAAKVVAKKLKRSMPTDTARPTPAQRNEPVLFGDLEDE